MNEKERKELIKTSWDLHSIVENSYLEYTAAKGDEQ